MAKLLQDDVLTPGWCNFYL